MLAYFNVATQYYTTRASIHVDCREREASLLVTHRGVIRRHGPLPAAHWDRLRTPELADAYLRQQVDTGRGDTAALVEHLHHQHESAAAAAGEAP